MKVYNSFEVIGDNVSLNRTSPKHMDTSGAMAESQDQDVATSFGQLLNSALKKINTSQIRSDELTSKMITSPNEINIHEVMIAAQEAQMSLNFLKSVRDRVIRAYQDIINMR
ncbi:MAG: flagellar hook-basal body complex protein FliE [bacterium]|nr:flagellar hook-basal body complex protein FliE [bacterium]